MFDHRVVSPLPDASASAVLRDARQHQADARRAEAGLLRTALEWAHLHPAQQHSPEADDAAVFHDVAGIEPIAGTGCPGVAEFAVPEFGAALGMSTTSAKRLIGHALELAHRLPRLWSRVLAHEVEPWRARRVAEATIHAHPRLTPAAAHWIDAQVAPFAGRVGQAQIDRLVEAAITQFAAATNDADDTADELVARLHVSVHDDPTASGTLDLTATLTTADALDLEHAVRAGAENLKAWGSDEPLGARRARALGQLARRQTALDLASGSPEDQPAADVLDSSNDNGTRPRPAARRLDLHLHFDVTSTHGIASIGHLENGQRLVRLDQLASWLNDSHTEVRVLPVLDLNTPQSSPGYSPAPLLRRQIELRDRTCVFPWCSRPARNCDLDHVVPYDHGRRPTADRSGVPQTRTDNLAALCRSHHRLKTHGGWHLRTLGPGTFAWTSPLGHRYLRDPSGTHRTETPPASAPPTSAAPASASRRHRRASILGQPQVFARKLQ